MQYSAGFTKEKWSEHEMYIVIELMKQNKTKIEILDEVTEKNLFQLRSPVSIKNRFNMVYRRAAVLGDELQQHFLNAVDYDRRALTLYSFLQVYRVPLEFYWERIVYKYELQESLYANDFHYFFEEKANRDEKVRNWRAETVKRLIRSLNLFFKEANMIEKVDQTKYSIHPIHMTQSLRTYSEKNEPLLYSFTVLEKVNKS
ncbi:MULTISPECIES: DUF1819 family protein [Pontibacillus]|uniref:DUF1819 family protein n=1 Tax=Pontibacillus chungwhensis TaxID=265426 RepID=A0ABY8V535_9BACI|nr:MULTISPECIES: DUF1819 family protein [Pontibacillus]MCD5325371.1 DUF1819 family protein [Pontibacillus sp. HN14]WIG00112.1 DUF1819 family protein [Pontibacillus chungwhensis]